MWNMKFLLLLWFIWANWQCVMSWQISWRLVKPLPMPLFNGFQNGSHPPFCIFKIQILTTNRVKMTNLRQMPNFVRLVEPLLRYGDLSIISKWRPSVILDLLYAFWDYWRRLPCGLYRCAKFGWNRCSSFDNMKTLTFCEIGLKTPIHAPFGRCLGVLTPNC